MLYDYLMAMTAPQREAWSALRRSPAVLHTADLPGMTAELAAGLPRQRTTCTGYSPALASARLVAHGMEPGRAELLVRQAILTRFKAFAYSWSGYIANHGWMQELKQLSQAQQAEFVARFFDGTPPDFATLLQQGRSGTLQAVPALLAAGARFSRLELGEYDSNPTWAMLTLRHGMPPELAAAVISQCRAAPGWMIPVVAMLGLVCAGILLAGQARPDDPAFSGMGHGFGGFVARTILAVLALGLLAGSIYMAWDKPRRERQTREHLARFKHSEPAQWPHTAG